MFYRDEFASDIAGKPKKYLLDKYGRPEKTQHNGSNEYWYYAITIDPITCKQDHSAQVVIKDGMIRYVNF
jgi:hypothetical protein